MFYTALHLYEVLRFEERWVSEAWITELLEHGVLVPDCQQGQLFSELQLEKARAATRLHRELQIDPPDLELALELLMRIVNLEDRMADLEMQALWTIGAEEVRYYH